MPVSSWICEITVFLVVAYLTGAWSSLEKPSKKDDLKPFFSIVDRIVQAALWLLYLTGIDPSAKLRFTFTLYTILQPTRNWIWGLDIFGDISITEYIEKDLSMFSRWDALHCCPGSTWLLAILTYSTKWKLGSKLQKCELDCNCSKHQCIGNKQYYKVIIWLQLLLIILCTCLKMVSTFLENV